MSRKERGGQATADAGAADAVKADEAALDDAAANDAARARAYDCQACGACCLNPRHNRAHGIVDYVQVFPADALFQRRGLREKWTLMTAPDEWHMRMDRTGKCLALTGEIGKRVSCGIYHVRPFVCGRLQAGSEQCITARRENRLSAAP